MASSPSVIRPSPLASMIGSPFNASIRLCVNVQFLVEACILSVIGGVLGLFVGAAVARDVASRLVAKKVLERVGRGTYLVRPLRSQSRPTSVSAPVQAAILLQGEPYYLSGLWAMTFHRLTEQQYVSVLDAFVDRRHPGRRLGSARLVFHRVSAERLQYGVVAVDIEGMQVRISDPERTVLDLLDLPALAGGAREALVMAKQVLLKLDLAKLVVRRARRAEQHVSAAGSSARALRDGAAASG